MDGLARSALNYLDQVYDYVIPVVWSTWEMQESPGAVERWQNLYAGDITPAAYFGGTHAYFEWDCSTMNYELAYNEISALESPIDMSVSIDLLRAETFELTSTILLNSDISSTDNKIFFIITNRAEYTTTDPWYFLVVAKSDELDMNLTSSGEMETYNATLSFTMQQGWSLDDLYAIAVVQSSDSRQVVQAAQIKYEGTGNTEILPPVDVTLSQNYPNPFNPDTTIGFALSEGSMVNLEVFNQKGQKVKTLLNAHREAGFHQVQWNGTDKTNKKVPSGIYLYKIHSESPEGGKYTSVKKMILLK